MAKELSVFIDESGDFGEVKERPSYYLVTFVMHDQSKSIDEQVTKLENSIKNGGFDVEYIHTGPVIRREDVFSGYSIDERRKLLFKMLNFFTSCPITCMTAIVDRKEAFDKVALSGKLAREISKLLNAHQDFFGSFDKFIIYYDNGQNELSAIFNHAVRYYDLNGNPVKKAGPIGIVRANEVNYWTKEEYLRFIESMKDNNKYYYALEILYWCGLRTGEVLALTESDFDFVNHTVSITKSFQIINGAEVITKPKTINGIRTVTVPVSLCKQLKEYVGQLNDGERLFPYARQRLYKELKKGIQISGVKDIRLHDLRHSHVSLLIHMGYTAFEIAKRVGHKSERVTYYYAHMFPGVQENMAERLDAERNISTT